MSTDWWGRTIIWINWDTTSNSCEISLKWLASCWTLSMTTDRRPSNFPTWSKFMIVVYWTDMFTDRKMYDKISFSSSNTTFSTTLAWWTYETTTISTTAWRITWWSYQSNSYILAHATASWCTNPFPDLLKICYNDNNTCYSMHDTWNYWFDDYQDWCWLGDWWWNQTYRWYKSYVMVK
jgi:hypothetical protein